MKRITSWMTPGLLALGGGFSGVAMADDGDRSARGAAILEAMELPTAAHRLRAAGVDAGEVKVALEALRKGSPAAEAGRPAENGSGVDGDDKGARRAARALGTEAAAAREHGPMKGFGTFVKTRVEEGMRGKSLAEAIKAERAARKSAEGDRDGHGHHGHDHGDDHHDHGHDHEHGNGGGKPDAPGKAGEQGKPAAPGKAGEQGKPDAPGKAGEQGKPEAPGKAGQKGKTDAPGKAGKGPGRP